jgi:hypothetical protein
MNIFERYLSLWVALCIATGIAFGQLFPTLVEGIAQVEIAKVNLPVGLLIWVMIIPMLVKVDFSSIHQVKQHWRGISVTLFINWAVKPFSMALLGWIFIRVLFAPYLPADQIDSYMSFMAINRNLNSYITSDVFFDQNNTTGTVIQIDDSIKPIITQYNDKVILSIIVLISLFIILFFYLCINFSIKN